MELRYLRYFVEVANTGSITAAATRLRVAQTALSRQLRLLEAEVGYDLMERSSRGVLLSDAGRAFAADVSKILSDLNLAVSKLRARSSGEIGEVSVGYAPSPTSELLPAALAILKEKAPKVQVVLQDLSGDEILAGLSDGQIKLAAMVDPGKLLPKNVIFHPLRQYRQCVAVPPKHRFARKSSVSLAELRSESFVVYERRKYAEYFASITETLGAAKIIPKIGAEVDGLTSLIAAILSGRGISLVTEIFPRLSGNTVRVVPIDPAPPKICVGYAYRADLPLSPVSKKLISAMKTVAKAARASAY